MNIIELQGKLTKLNINIPDADICKIWGMDTSSFSRKKKLGSEIKHKNIQQLEKALKIKLIDYENNVNMFDDTVTLDYFPDVCGSCGNGVFQFSTYKEQMVVAKSNFCTRFSPHKKYFVINAYGDSMQPLIYDKDKLIVEHWDGEQIIDNKPYIFCRNDEIFVKRLVKNVNQLLIIPDNKAYDTIKLTDEQMNEVDIIGQIVGLMRDLR